jgi:GcrA cell cycle regulator
MGDVQLRPAESQTLPESSIAYPTQGEKKSRPRDDAPLTTVELRMVLPPHASPAWPMDRLLALCALWASGLIASTIGMRLGVTKSAVLGKAHRLAACNILTLRDNPSAASRQSKEERAEAMRQCSHDFRERRKGEPLRPYVHHARATPAAAPVAARPVTVPSPAAIPQAPVPAALDRPPDPPPKPKGCGTGSRPPGTFAPPPLPSLAALSPPSPVTFASAYRGRIGECCWPIGDPRTPAFRFCDGPSEPGRPYCLAHEARAHGHKPSPEAEARP